MSEIDLIFRTPQFVRAGDAPDAHAPEPDYDSDLELARHLVHDCANYTVWAVVTLAEKAPDDYARLLRTTPARDLSARAAAEARNPRLAAESRVLRVIHPGYDHLNTTDRMRLRSDLGGTLSALVDAGFTVTYPA